MGRPKKNKTEVDKPTDINELEVQKPEDGIVNLEETKKESQEIKLVSAELIHKTFKALSLSVRNDFPSKEYIERIYEYLDVTEETDEVGLNSFSTFIKDNYTPELLEALEINPEFVKRAKEDLR